MKMEAGFVCQKLCVLQLPEKWSEILRDSTYNQTVESEEANLRKIELVWNICSC